MTYQEATEIQNAMYRPCFVDGKKALFHRWTAYNVIDYAIVEYEDGTVDIVHPQSIRFVSGKVEEFINKRYDERITNLTLELFKEMQKAQEPEDEIKEKAPYRTTKGKYILIEVKE